MSDSAPPKPAADSGWFGFQPVDPSEKTGRVREVFDRVASRYDLMNDLMSGGVHRLWKASFLTRIRPRSTKLLIDLAGGTGDIASGWLRRAGGGHAVICDINESMLRVGQARAAKAGLPGRLDFVTGNAEALPFADASADVITIAFGLRNVTYIDAALAEARRVLKPGGRFHCLEFSRVALPALRRAYDAYSFSVLPWLGEVVAKDRESYRYLAESIRRFPDQPSLAERMRAAGMARVEWQNLSAGIAAVHTGWRL